MLRKIIGATLIAAPFVGIAIFAYLIWWKYF